MIIIKAITTDFISLVVSFISSLKNYDAKPLTNSVPVWANEDVSLGDSLIRQTDGVSYTVANTAKNKQVVFHIAPARLDVNDGFTCLNVRIGASTQVTNFACAEFILDSKYAGDVPSSVVVD